MSVDAYINVLKSKTLIECKSVLEIGSRDGHHAAQLADAFNVPSSCVYVVEANPYCAKIIRQNYPSFNTFQFAISDRNATIKFFAYDPALGSEVLGQSSTLSRVSEKNQQSKAELLVNSFTGSYFFYKYKIERIDICKIDVEGASLQVLKGFGNEINKIKSFHVELEHQVIWEGQALYQDVCSYLKNNGYSEVYFKLYNDIQSDSIWVLDGLIYEK